MCLQTARSRSLDSVISTSRKHTCLQCGKSFSNAQNFRQHEPIHSGIYPYRCDICHQGGSHMIVLSLQMATSCPDSVIPSASKHTCLQCGSSFSRLHFLRLHEAAHGGYYPFRCEICGKGSLNSSNLRRHMSTHSDKTEHKCTVCNLSFRYESSLKRHFEHCHNDLSLESHNNSVM